jgi:hypothetical protein
MTRTTTAISRRTVGGSTLGRPTAELRAASTTGAMPTLQRAVVVEIIDNPSALTEEQKQILADQVNNPEFVDILPVNSILARMVSDSQDAGNPTSALLFPLFSGCMELPIVPGEHVWVIYPDSARSGTVIGYWITKVSEQRTVEDPNYTVHDRRFLPQYNPQALSTTERSQNQDITPDFPNGAGTPATATLRVTGSNNENPYDGIVENSTAIANFTFEPVPRWNKRPGEYVIQGRNNSTIVLGEDRTGPVVRAEADAIGRAGSIDLVAGRARTLPPDENTDPEDTAPRLIENARSKLEVNKTPYLIDGRQDNPREGDPDLINDAARLLVTMQSEVDVNFGITNINFPTDTLEPVQPNDGSAGTLGKSYVVAKADNIRIIARKDDDVDGTILIIREGTGEDDLAYLYIDATGKLQIYAPEIYLGKATGKAEPYIKWTEYKNTINHLQDEISSVREKLQNQLDEINTKYNRLVSTLTIAFSAATAVPYSPIASLTAAGSNIINLGRDLAGVITTNKTEAETAVREGKTNTDQDIDNSKSERIFGE